MKTKLAEAKKFIVAIVGAAGEAVALGLFTGNVARIIGIGIAVIAATGVYVIPNKPQAVPPHG